MVMMLGGPTCDDKLFYRVQNGPEDAKHAFERLEDILGNKNSVKVQGADDLIIERNKSLFGDVEIIIKKEYDLGKSYEIFKFVKDVPAVCALGGCNRKAEADVKYYVERYDFPRENLFSSRWKELAISASMYSGQHFSVLDIEEYSSIFGLQSETCCSSLGWENWCTPDR